MAELAADCPRCGVKAMTFDVVACHTLHQQYGWMLTYEAFGKCRQCRRSTIFVLKDHADADYDHAHAKGLLNLDEALNNYVTIERFINISDLASVDPPEHLPETIEAVFIEGAKCVAISCFNAAATMFRLCIDLATRDMLPDGEDGPNATTRRNLGLRLPWLFDNHKLPESLRDLSNCVKEDGNDGAHAGTLTKDEAIDLLDFTKLLLERLYTEPVRLRLAAERRDKRRNPEGSA